MELSPFYSIYHMLRQYVVGINWVDFLMIGIVIRMCYIGIKTGVGIEIFKLIALWLTTVITMQVYSTPLADWLHGHLPALPLDAADVFVFVTLLTIIILVVRMIRESFFLLIKIEAQSTVNRFFGLLLGLTRGLWISSLVLIIMTISTVQYLEISAKSSLFGNRLIYMAPQIYKGSHNGLISKLFSDVEFNEEIFNAVER